MKNQYTLHTFSYNPHLVYKNDMDEKTVINSVVSLQKKWKKEGASVYSNATPNVEAKLVANGYRDNGRYFIKDLREQSLPPQSRKWCILYAGVTF